MFFGVPYAGAPRGAARFASPKPPARWTGERDARSFGPSAPQPPRGRLGDLDLSPFFGDGWVRGDEYLSVNVWAPRTNVEDAPVIVFVHGGAFIAGSNRAPAYDGDAFARDGVVFVTVNYRLGIPGFLHVPDAPDNRGLLDVLAALGWVRNNIAAFGGDPGNVTVMGQSAGAIIVGALLADPRASGLMARAIVQSGTGTGVFTTEQAGLVTARLGTLLDTDASAAHLSGVDDATLVALASQVGSLDVTTPTARAPLSGITVFGLVLDETPVDSVITSSGPLPDLLIGDNADESALYVAPHGLLPQTTRRDLLEAAARFSTHPEALVQHFRDAVPDASAGELLVAILSHGHFGQGTRMLREAHAARDDGRTWAYRFAWRSDACGGGLGASHLMELPFVFGQQGQPSLRGAHALFGSEVPPDALAGSMHAAWVRFATHGDPGWPRDDGSSRATKVFS